MTTLTKDCPECNKTFEITARRYKQSIKRGQVHFCCSPECKFSFKKKQKEESVNCPKCNSVFTRNKKISKIKKYCSVKCANSHIWSEESRQKASEAKLRFNRNDPNKQILERDKIIHINCEECGSQFSKTKFSTIRFCNNSCRLKARAKKGNLGGYRPHSGRAKTGFYKGMYCGSTYELAFLIWNQDHGANVKRCDKVFLYGNSKKYHPDFEINDVIYEIKGYFTPEVQLKEEAVRDKGFQYHILYRQDLQKMIDYVKDKYKVKELQTLYDDPQQFRFQYHCASCGKQINTNKKRKSEYKFCSRKCLNPHLTNDKFNGIIE